MQRRVVAGARDWLAAGGSVLVETSERQTPSTLAAFEGSGFTTRVVTDDGLGATVVLGYAAIADDMAGSLA
jgi:release factor glutamine methyltransferase